ncbi:hypothetical protein Dsin_015499 [Dipteronia sinensis]|uniref:Auxin-responsive protein n=1 Tax=Dipteronia sinensis TaxID=43782 RepID=A0AAE0AC90_9ROSI|nr:hypothetical protein Dsin_015499 [Dipteronia sinensis]
MEGILNVISSTASLNCLSSSSSSTTALLDCLSSSAVTISLDCVSHSAATSGLLPPTSSTANITQPSISFSPPSTAFNPVKGTERKVTGIISEAYMAEDSITAESSGRDVSSMNLQETELTLGLPGSPPVVVTRGKSCPKRGFIDTVDLNLGSSLSNPRHDPATKAQVVGWPPVRSSRKKSLEMSKLVKVSVDGAPYLRKVDLHMHTSYQQLFRALEQIFTCFTIHECSSNHANESD